jgi:hypothetical protein
MSEKIVNVVCIKWGDLYGYEYVNRLYAMVKRNLQRPFKFYCITDNSQGLRQEVLHRPLPDFHVPQSAQGPWKKLILFQRELFDIQGKTMFLDLDVVIVGPLDRFFTFSELFSVRHEFEKRKENDTFGNTSMYVYTIGTCSEIYEGYLQNQNAIHSQYYTAEQEYVTRTLYNAGKLDFFPNDWILSFKEHCLPSLPMRWWQVPQLPAGASIIAFHGRPFPEDVINGRWPLDGKPRWKALYKYVRRCPWIEEHWRE